MRDFVVWEPGETLVCSICGSKRGDADPPGPWTRHYGSARRRAPIYGEGPGALGWFVYRHL